MKYIVLFLATLLTCTLLPAQNETVNGNLTVHGRINADNHIKGKYLFTTDGNATGAVFTYPGNQNLYVASGKDTSGNKNEIILYNYGCRDGCNTPQIRLLTDQMYTTGKFYQNISGAESGWVHRIRLGAQTSGFHSNAGTPSLYLRTADGDNNVLIRPNGSSYLNGGNVGIGTTNPGQWKLAVNGNIRAKEIKVESGWADFVFYDDYRLPSLNEVENHIKRHGHLKDIPSAQEVEEQGVFLGEMNAKLLQKIEELTLYTIQQDKEILELQKQIAGITALLESRQYTDH